MDADQPDGDSEVREQLEDLRSRANAADRRLLQVNPARTRLKSRADDSATRADAAAGRTNAEVKRSSDDHRRIAEIEGRVDVHDEMIAELQAEGLVSSEQARNLDGGPADRPHGWWRRRNRHDSVPR